MKYIIEEVKGEPDKNIVMRFRGDDIVFVATANNISLYIDERTADSIAFHLQTIIEDRKRQKKNSS